MQHFQADNIGEIVSLVNACLPEDLVHGDGLLNFGELLENVEREHLPFELGFDRLLAEFKLSHLVASAEIVDLRLGNRIGRVLSFVLLANLSYFLLERPLFFAVLHVGLSCFAVARQRDANVLIEGAHDIPLGLIFPVELFLDALIEVQFDLWPAVEC